MRSPSRDQMVMMSIHQVSIGWEDEEGDLVTVSTDEELAHALQCKRRCQKNLKEIMIFGFIRQGQNDEDTVGLFRLEVTLVENPWWLQVIIVNISIVIIIIVVVIVSKNNCVTFMLNFPGWLCPDPR